MLITPPQLKYSQKSIIKVKYYLTNFINNLCSDISYTITYRFITLFSQQHVVYKFQDGFLSVQQYLKKMSQFQLPETIYALQFFCFSCNHQFDSETHTPYLVGSPNRTICHQCLAKPASLPTENGESGSSSTGKPAASRLPANKFLHLAELKAAVAKSEQTAADKLSETEQSGEAQELLQKEREKTRWLLQYCGDLNQKYQQALLKEKQREAELARKIGKYQTSLEKLSHDFWKVRGDKEFQQQNFQRIVQFSQHIIKNSPNFDYKTQGFGCVQDQIGLFEQDPVKWYSTGRADNRFSSSPYDILSLSYLITRNYGQAEMWYRGRLNKNHHNYQLILSLANTEYNQGRYEEAEKLYARVIEMKPELDKPYQEIAFIKFLKQHKRAEGRQWALKAKERNSQNIYADYIIASTEDTVDLQIQSLIKLSEHAKGYARVYNGLGSAYKIKKQFEESIKWYKKAIEINPKYEAPYNGIAIVHFFKEEFDEAIRWFQECVKVNPRYEHAYFGLGTVYHKKNNNQEAVKYYKKCYEINPLNSAAYNGVGMIDAVLGRYDEAINSFKKCIEINPNHELSHNSLGNVYFNKGQYDEAIKCYLKCIELNAKYAAPYNGLSNAYSKKGDLEEAKKWHQKKVQALK